MLTADWFVGIDWASEAHAVCLVDREGRVADQREVKHTATALHDFIGALARRDDGGFCRRVNLLHRSMQD